MDGLMRLTLLIGSILIASFAFGQDGSISGRVVSGDSALASATIVLQKRSTLSDSSGSFSYDGLSKGKYHLNVSMIGYEPYHKIIDLKEGEEKHVHVELLKS